MSFADSILRHDPLLIEPRLLTAFVERCSSFSERIKEIFGEPPQAQVENGVGVVPISGIIGQGLLPIEKLFGATDVDDLSETLEAFAGNPSVHTLLLDIDSPGGTEGVQEKAVKRFQ